MSPLNQKMTAVTSFIQKRKPAFLVFTGIIFLMFIGLSLYFFLYKEKGPKSDRPLTEKDRLEILQQMSKDVSGEPVVSPEEKESIIKSFSSEKKDAPLSNGDRQQVLDQISVDTQ